MMILGYYDIWRLGNYEIGKLGYLHDALFR